MHNLLADEVERLAAAVKAGDLNQRIPEQEFEGRSLETVRALNQMLDTITKPLTEVKAVLAGLAVNDLAVNVTGTYSGAFGEIATATNLAQQRVKHTVAILNNLAAGDFKKDLEDMIKLQRRSENDSLVPAFIQVMLAISALVDDSKMLSAAAVEGKLATRADATKHSGEYRKIVEGVNQTLDAVIGPLNVAADYVDKISKGEIPAKITTEYQGDFNAIKQSLNRCIDTLDTLLTQMSHMSQRARVG